MTWLRENNGQVAALALIVVLLGTTVAVVAGLASQLGLWSTGTGFSVVRWGAYFVAVGGAMSILSTLVAIRLHGARICQQHAASFGRTDYRSNCDLCALRGLAARQSADPRRDDRYGQPTGIRGGAAAARRNWSPQHSRIPAHMDARRKGNQRP